MKESKLSTLLLATLLIISILACKKEEEEPTTQNNDAASYTITVGAFSLSNGTYTALGKQLVFDSQEECQTWSRTAGGDSHDANDHLHYNAAANVSYDNSTTTFSYTEYGPEISQAAIETTCANGANGVSKTVNNTSYYQDKPNVYLKITGVVEN